MIQKHAASRLHYDLRLEVDGVMKSWAVPKGPSLDPSVKRVAVHVEDHPIEYNDFEGTIPEGEYGGGTVMLWGKGTYTSAGDEDDPEETLREGYRKGDFKFILRGKRLKGSWVPLAQFLGLRAEPPLEPVEQYREGRPHVTDLVLQLVHPRLERPGAAFRRLRPGLSGLGLRAGRLGCRFRVAQLNLLNQVPDERHSPSGETWWFHPE